MSGRAMTLGYGSDSRFLSERECAAIAGRIMRYAKGGGQTEVAASSWWSGELRWGRNRPTLASDRRDLTVEITRTIRGARGQASTNQVDAVSLEAAVRDAERNLRYQERAPDDFRPPPVTFEYPATSIWSDRTYELTAADRRDVCRMMVSAAEGRRLLSAGYIEVQAGSKARFHSEGQAIYAQYTSAQCSTTVREPAGTASGWAGLSSYDWGQIDPRALAARALEKCVASRDAVAIEPGRYTVILEPQAVGDLMQRFVRHALDRGEAEGGRGPFATDDNRAKLGLKVVDERVTLGHDPADPQLGVIPFVDWSPVRRVTWIDRGVLTTLAYDRDYALQLLMENLGYYNTQAFRLSGGTTSIEEMIHTTQRGLLVTRFSNVGLLDDDSVLLTGLTRDGLWLIENGRISKAARNLRFTESPVFVLNSLEQLGAPVPIFSPGTPVLVPPLKARDFSFTSLADAV